MITEPVQYRVSPELLRWDGPPIGVVVAGRAGLALLDTGAGISCVDIAFAASLQLSEEGTHEVTGATGTGAYPKFKTDLYVPPLKVAVSSPIVGVPLRRMGHPWDAIIGRDVLCQFEMTVQRKDRPDTLQASALAFRSFKEFLPHFGLERLGLIFLVLLPAPTRTR